MDSLVSIGEKLDIPNNKARILIIDKPTDSIRSQISNCFPSQEPSNQPELIWYPIGLFWDFPGLSRRLDIWIKNHLSYKSQAKQLICPTYGIVNLTQPTYIAVVVYLRLGEGKSTAIQRQILGAFLTLKQAHSVIKNIIKCPIGEKGTEFLKNTLPLTPVFYWRCYRAQMLTCEIYRQYLSGSESLNQTVFNIYNPVSQLIKRIPVACPTKLEDYIGLSSKDTYQPVNLIQL